MKKLLLIAGILLATGSAYAYFHYSEARCTGASNCSACKNCKYCKHCAQDGGSCGVCK